MPRVLGHRLPPGQLLALQAALVLVLCALHAIARGAPSFLHPPHDAHQNKFDYCVIGAGPGGVQAAIYFQQLGMSHVVFERSERAGNFFSRYPRHRRLISINKRFTGKADAEFQMRHDWNSLITHFDAGTEDVPYALNDWWLFRPYSKEYFPNAGLLVDYMSDLVQRYGLNVRFNHTVRSVKRLKTKAAPFVLEFAESGRGPVQCRVLVVATGRFVPMKLRPEQEAFVEGYEVAPNDGASYRDQRVAILGTGNAAMEAAETIYEDAAYVHMAGRYPMTLAWQTHYVGHSRALSFGILDRTQLKTMDALLHGLPFDKLEFSRDNVTMRVVIKVDGKAMDGSGGRARHLGYDRVLRCTGFLWDSSIFNVSADTASIAGGQCNRDVSVGCGGAGEASSTGAPDGGVPPLDQSNVVAPYSEPKKRYLDIASNFESVNVPRLFVAGTLMHFRDFKKSSGGFIHGFRYLVRTMVLQMRERFERKPYPSTIYGPFKNVDSASASLAQSILQRLRNVSSLYQLPGHLSDVVVNGPDSEVVNGRGSFTVRRVPDIPMDQCKSRNPKVIASAHVRDAQAFMTISIEFGKEFQGLGILHHHAQPEPKWRTLEKKVWDEESDADVRMLNASAGPSMMKMRRDDMSIMYDAFHPHRSPPDASEAQDYTEAPQANGYNFIHPVFRVYTRKGQRPGVDAPRQIMEFALLEDLHNDWTLSARHVQPLQRFLKAALPKLMVPPGGSGKAPSR